MNRESLIKEIKKMREYYDVDVLKNLERVVKKFNALKLTKAKCERSEKNEAENTETRIILLLHALWDFSKSLNYLSKHIFLASLRNDFEIGHDERLKKEVKDNALLDTINKKKEEAQNELPGRTK